MNKYSAIGSRQHVDYRLHDDFLQVNDCLKNISIKTSVTGSLFLRSTPAVIFWQTVNQTFNAIVNYTNRNASAGVTNEQVCALCFMQLFHR